MLTELPSIFIHPAQCLNPIDDDILPPEREPKLGKLAREGPLKSAQVGGEVQDLRKDDERKRNI